jgi:hypothetical protein
MEESAVLKFQHPLEVVLATVAEHRQLYLIL